MIALPSAKARPVLALRVAAAASVCTATPTLPSVRRNYMGPDYCTSTVSVMIRSSVPGQLEGSLMKPKQECPQAAGCELYGLLKLAGTLAVWQMNYCSADYSKCKRYQLTTMDRKPPANLLPNGSLLRHLGGKANDK